METYLGNPNLKKANVTQEWTKQEVEEYAKCMKDPLYFIQEYIKIVSLDEGLVPFKLYDFQKEMVGTFHNNRFTICKLPRQSGKSTTIIAYLLHYVLVVRTILYFWMSLHMYHLMLQNNSLVLYILQYHLVKQQKL